MLSNPLALIFLLTVLAVGDYSAKGDLPPDTIDSRADSTAVVRTVSRFHDAIKNGDTAAVKSLIASDLRVLEGGEVENRTQYLSHHLSADMDFAKAVDGESKAVSYTRQGNVAWVVSTSTATGKFNGRNINSIGAELMILSRTQKAWQIRVIHWSSARRQTP
jgi:ketosteroid isomerase-like protein